MEKYICMYRLYKEKERSIGAHFSIYVLYEEIGINGRKCFTCHPVLAPLIP